MEEKLNSLDEIHKEDKSKTKVCNEEVQELNEKNNVLQRNLNRLRQDLDEKIVEVESVKSNLEEREKNFILVKAELESKITELT